MKISISKSEIKGNLKVPSSKSYTIRGFIAAAMAKGESRIIDPLASDDTEAAKGMLTGIGVKISESGDEWKINGGNFIAPLSDLYAAESATTFRFMTAIASLVPGKCRLVPGPGLSKRPITPLLEALYRLGVKSSLDGKGAVTVEGGTPNERRVIQRRLEKRHVGRPLSVDRLERDVLALSGTDRYDVVSYHLDPVPDGAALAVLLQPKT